jgi:hypothetical protein
MKDRIFEELLGAEKNRVLPACPSRVETNVLRRVRLASSDTAEIGGLDWLFGLLPQKGVVCGFLGVTLFMSIAATMVVSTNSSYPAETQGRAVIALDFGFFKETSIINLGS